MTSHGVARASRPRTEEQRQIDLDKISHYRDLEHQVRQKTADQNYGQETLQLTSKLLRLNPEYYTVWNVRRRCIISGSLSKASLGPPLSKASPTILATTTPVASSEESLPSSYETQPHPNSQTAGKTGTTAEACERHLQVITSELTFTVPLLMEYPKCYWIWNYRLWTLNQAIQRLPVSAARRVWEEELGLVGKMLQRDRRNFHAWGYRRHVVIQLESPELAGKTMAESEFDYTTKAVRQDLSNFSAWHNRCQLIPRVLSERSADDAHRKEFLEAELALIRNGLNVGPEDQSLWFYHQYLVSNIVDRPSDHTIAPRLTQDERKFYLQREIDDIKDLLEDYTDIKWIYEALIEYTRALSHLKGTSVNNQEGNDITDWVCKLRELDPKRSGRWNDLDKKLGVA